MLFVSRRVGYDRVGICDTDDGIEEIVHRKDLLSICQSGVVIKGVWNPSGHSMDTATAVDNTVVQDPSTVTRYQTKLKTIYGIDTVVFRGEIAKISWRNKKVSKVVVVKLSDLGDTLGNWAIAGNHDNENTQVILSFDDSVKVLEGALFLTSLHDNAGVMYDVSAVRDDRNAKRVYAEVCESLHWETASKYILDVPERKQRLGEILTRIPSVSSLYY